MAAAAVVAMLGCAGCASPAMVVAPAAVDFATLGTSAYTSGSMRAAYARPFDEVVVATRSMVSELELKILRERESDGALYISAEDLTEVSYTIRVERRTPQITRVSIRIGWLGDQPLSTLLMDYIDSRLRGDPPPHGSTLRSGR